MVVGTSKGSGAGVGNLPVSSVGDEMAAMRAECRPLPSGQGEGPMDAATAAIPARKLLDLAATLSERALERASDHAEIQRLTGCPALDASPGPTPATGARPSSDAR